MKNIGILLPKSSTHPEIGYDFFFGIKAFCFLHSGFNPNFHTGNIGFGVDEDLLYSEAERMFLEKSVDALIVFADHPKVDKIFPLASQFRRPILVVNAGAKYPITWDAPDYVVFLSMDEILSAKLAGSRVVSELGIIRGINASNFYDGGYGIGDAFFLGFEKSGGEILFNYVSKHLVADFDPSSLLEFISENQEPILIFSLYTGKILPLFLEAIDKSKTKDILVCSAGMINEIISSGYFLNKTLPEVFAFSSMNPDWRTTGFQPLNDYFKTELNREVSLFSFLGWDAGEVLVNLISANDLQNSGKWNELSSILKGKTISGSRGELKFHSKTGHFLCEQFQIKLREGEFEVLKISLEEVFEEWEQVIENRPVPPQVGWFNTYLCS